MWERVEIEGKLKEKNTVGRLILSDFKTHYKAIVIKKVWKSRQIDQRNRKELRNRPTEIMSADLWRRGKGNNTTEQKVSLQRMILDMKEIIDMLNSLKLFKKTTLLCER